jgi:hypothetical protein
MQAGIVEKSNQIDEKLKSLIEALRGPKNNQAAT